MVHKRTEERERGRRLVRLAVSVDTLLRLKLRLPVPPNLNHTLPIPPSEARRLLRRLAAGRDILDETCTAAEVMSDTDLYKVLGPTLEASWRSLGAC